MSLKRCNSWNQFKRYPVKNPFLLNLEGTQVIKGDANLIFADLCFFNNKMHT